MKTEREKDWKQISYFVFIQVYILFNTHIIKVYV